MSKLKFAVLIDGDNISPKLLKPIITEINKEGDIVLKRIYGDWTTPNFNGWKELLQEIPIRPFQQFRYGENATDGSLIMDAIELVTNSIKTFNAFAIVSSDSDFYSLALRLREHGMYVLGMGKRETRDILVNACNQFIYFDNLVTTESAPKNNHNENYNIPLENIIQTAYSSLILDNDNYVSLSNLGQSIRKQFPGFDPRSYNHHSLIEIVKSFPSRFEVKHDKLTPPNYWIRKKTPPTNKTNIKRGKIKRYIHNYGFIEAEDGDYFFTISNALSEDREEKLEMGQEVEFEVFKQPNPNSEIKEEKNGKATNIRFI